MKEFFHVNYKELKTDCSCFRLQQVPINLLIKVMSCNLNITVYSSNSSTFFLLSSYFCNILLRHKNPSD